MALPTGLREFQAELSSSRKNHRPEQDHSKNRDDEEYIRSMALRIHAVHYVTEVITRSVKIFNNEIRRNSDIPGHSSAEESHVTGPPMISVKVKSSDDLIPQQFTRAPPYRRFNVASGNPRNGATTAPRASQGQTEVTRELYGQAEVTRASHGQAEGTRALHGQAEVTRALHGQAEVTRALHGQAEVTRALHGQAEVTRALHGQAEVTRALHGQAEVTRALQGQAEVTRALHGQAEVTRALHGQAEVTRALHGQAEVTRALHGQAEVTRALHGQAEVTRALQGQAEVTRALHGQAEMTRALQGQAEVTRALHGQAEVTRDNFSEAGTSVLRSSDHEKMTTDTVPKDTGEEMARRQIENSEPDVEMLSNDDCRLGTESTSEEHAFGKGRMKNDRNVSIDADRSPEADSGQIPVSPLKQSISRAPPNTPIFQISSNTLNFNKSSNWGKKDSEFPPPTELWAESSPCSKYAEDKELTEEVLKTVSMSPNKFSGEAEQVNHAQEETAPVNDKMMITRNNENTRYDTRMSDGESAAVQRGSSRKRRSFESQKEDSDNSFSFVKTFTSIETGIERKVLIRSCSRLYLKEQNASVPKTRSLPGDLCRNENFGILLCRAEKRRLSLGPNPFASGVSSNTFVTRFASKAALETSSGVPFHRRRRSSIEVDTARADVMKVGTRSVFRKQLSAGELMTNINEEIPKTVLTDSNFRGPLRNDGVGAAAAEENQIFQDDRKPGEMNLAENDASEEAEKVTAESARPAGGEEKVGAVGSTGSNSDSPTRTLKDKQRKKKTLICSGSYPSFWESDKYLTTTGSSRVSATSEVNGNISNLSNRLVEGSAVDTVAHVKTAIANGEPANVLSIDNDPQTGAVSSTDPLGGTVRVTDPVGNGGKNALRETLSGRDLVECTVSDPAREGAFCSQDAPPNDPFGGCVPAGDDALSRASPVDGTVSSERLATRASSRETPATRAISGAEPLLTSNVSRNEFLASADPLVGSEFSAKCRVLEDNFFAHPAIPCKIPVISSLGQSPRFVHRRLRSANSRTPLRGPSQQDTSSVTPVVVSRPIASTDKEYLQDTLLGRYKKKLEDNSRGNTSAGWSSRSFCQQKRLPKTQDSRQCQPRNEFELSPAPDTLPDKNSQAEFSLGTPPEKQELNQAKLQLNLMTPSKKATTHDKEYSGIMPSDPRPSTPEIRLSARSTADDVEVCHEDDTPPPTAPECPGHSRPGPRGRERRFRFVLDVCRNCCRMGTGCTSLGDFSDSE